MLIKQFKLFVFTLSAFILATQLKAQSGLVVNEFSQGSPGQEWVELVVVGDCEVDLRGWIIDDNNGIFTDCGAGNNIEHGTFSGHGVAGGHIKFSNDATWAAVKAGTIIVVYDNGAFTGTLPSGENANVGDPTDANCDLLRWCPINSNSSAYFIQNSVSPTTGGGSGCNCATNNAPQGNFSYAAGGTPINNGSWASMGLRNDGDGVQVRSADGSFFHGFSYGSPGGSCGTSFGGGPDGLHFAVSGSNFTYQFRNTMNDDYRSFSNFQALTSGSNESPGEANTCANAIWINSMRYPVEDFFYPSCSPAVEAYDICQGQTATVGIPFTTCINSTWTLGAVSGSPATAFPVPGSLDAINGTIDVTGLLPGSITITLIATQDNSDLFPSCPNLTQTSEVGITINVGPGPVANSTFIIECEENPGSASIDLTSYDLTIGGGLQVDWYENSGPSNPISNPTNYTASNGSTVYAVVVDGLCSSSPAAITIAITPAPSASSAQIIDCAAPGASSSTVNLTSVENTITGGNPSNNVSFFTDAGANNPINSPGGFTVNVGSPVTVFAVVDDGSCSSDPVPVLINISATPNLDPIGTIDICAGDQIDLSNLVIETSGSNPSLTFYDGSSCSGSPIPALQTPTSPGINVFCVQALSGTCTDDQQVFVNVVPAGTPALQSASICDSDPIFDLTTLEDPFFTGGTWSGTGVSGTDFDPSGLNGIITLNYTPADCGNPATTTIEVSTAGTPVLSSASICSTDGAFDLSTLTDPNYPTGIWSGDYVSGNIFDPSQASGNETVTLTFTPSASCANIATTTIDVTITQTPALGTATLCQTDAVLDLTTLEDSNFPGGTWSGSGVSGTDFDPSGLDGDITLTYVPASGGVCVLDGSTVITVNLPQTPTLTSADVCVTTTNFDLTSLEDSNFPGGTWSGPGVTGTTFDASSQSGAVSLDYTANESCTNIASTTINVLDAPTYIVSSLIETCDPSNTTYVVSFEITGGDNSSYTIDNVPITGNVFTSGPIPSGTPYSFVLDDANNCNPETISGSLTCNCTTDAGTINTATALNLCDSTDIDVSTFYNNDFIDDGNDVLNFVIHTESGASLGTIIAISDTSIFTYPTGIPLDSTLYISPIAGNDDGTGMVDQSDPCLSVAPGLEIIVTNPDITFTVTNTICLEDCIPVTFNIGNTGVSPSNPITINYTLNTGSTDLLGQITLESDTTVSLDICESDTLNPGTVSLSFTDAEFNGCTIDYGSSQTSDIEILAPGVLDIVDTLCQDGSITVLGAVFDINQPSGSLTLGAQASNGCDSIININLLFPAPDTTFLSPTICTGGTYEVNGVNYDSNNPTDTISIPAGANNNTCDSIIVLNLNFQDAVIDTLSFELCEGDTQIVNNIVYDFFNPSGLDTIPNGSWLGCDSILDVNLTFFPNSIGTFTQTICATDSIMVGDSTFFAGNLTGTVILEDQSFFGCDSTVNVTIDLHPDAIGTFTQTICAADSIMVGDSTFFAGNLTGTVILEDQSFFGCDSIVNVTIDLHPDAIGTFTQTICATDSIMVGDSTFFAGNLSGTVILDNQSFFGCDSIVNVTIDLHPDAIGTFTQTICATDSIMVGDSTFFAGNLTGTVILDNQSFFGCDSIVNVTIDLHPDAIGTFTQTICATDSIMVGDSTFFAGNLTGTVILDNQSFFGCDSIVNVTIDLHPDAIGIFTQTICATDSIMVGDSTFFAGNLVGSVILENQSFFGCDSIVNVTIDLHPDAIGTFTQTICSTDSIMVGDSTFFAGNLTGTVILDNQSFFGCDSIVNVTIDLHPDAIGTFTQTICSTDSIMVGDSTFFAGNLTGTVILENQSFFGCDSTINVTIDLYPDAIGSFTQTICPGDSIVVAGSTFHAGNLTGTVLLENQSFFGCDSTINVTIDLHPDAVSTFTETICPGDSIVVAGSTFHAGNLTGTVILENQSSFGCDSTINVTIDLHPDAIGSFTQTICPGDSIVVGGSIFHAGNLTGAVTLENQSFFGCDSTINVTIDLYPEATEIINLEILSDETITINGTDYNIDNPSGQEIIPNGSLVNGCDSIINIQLSFIFEIESIISVLSPTCAGESDGALSIDDIENLSLPVTIVVVGPNGISNYEITNYPFEINDLGAGTYNLSYVDINAMVYSENITINDPNPYIIDAGGPFEVELGGSEFISITPDFNLDSISWTPNLYLNCDTCSTVIVSPEEAITYEVLAVNDLGCLATTTVIVDVFNSREVFIPNVFSPDFDGINDVFTVYTGSSVKTIETLQVFDRWGSLLYKADYLDPQNINVGWDGRFKGEILNPGVYVYYTIIEYLDGEREIFKGEITLIR